jgi:hypothetical protein
LTEGSDFRSEPRENRKKDRYPCTRTGATRQGSKRLKWDTPEVASWQFSLVRARPPACSLGTHNSPARALEPGKVWVASWTASPQGPYPAGWPAAQPDLSFALPHGDTEGASDQTFRLIVKPDLWSKTVRLRLANTFGSRPVTLGAVTVGLQSSGGNLLAGKAQPALFGGKPEAVIPVGEELYSDEVALGIDPADPLLEGRNLAVSFFVKGTSGPLTWHCDGFYTSYLTAPGGGDHTGDKNDAAFPFTTTSWFLLDAVEAQAEPGAAVVCAFGDSITEGGQQHP